MGKSKGNESHNVYYQKDNYRIRVYRNDKKIYEKQAKLSKYENYSISKLIIYILKGFIANISAKEDIYELYDQEFIKAMNKAWYFSELLEKLRSDENDN